MEYKHVDIVGMGPGNKKYILPEAMDIINASDVLIAGKRHLEDLSLPEKVNMEVESGLDNIVDFIKGNYENQKISVLVSGDTGFYSLLGYLQKRLEGIKLKTTPGISSVSYFMSRLNMLWHDGVLVSLHGKRTDFISVVRNNPKVIFLTDNKYTPSKIAEELVDAGIEGKRMIIGENLSYPEEKISTLSIREAVGYKSEKLCVAVIMNE
ncbi:MAG: precorrin-6y C5,15-methyltransferase (decarboxylating) subunit CbiE [Eubacteriaceae bacterium]|nr:precorrin-6y C5,15-methyltransferase (decarboxylating) subunit CbiE [Eubacteriaceae bacterium]